jgi:hypothetical protein
MYVFKHRYGDAFASTSGHKKSSNNIANTRYMFSFIYASMNSINRSRGKRKLETFIGNTRNNTNYLKENKFSIVGTI